MTFKDVVAVNIKSGRVRLLEKGKAITSAEAIRDMAVIRRGVDEEFYSIVPAGAYREGDKWQVKR